MELPFGDIIEYPLALSRSFEAIWKARPIAPFVEDGTQIPFPLKEIIIISYNA